MLQKLSLVRSVFEWKGQQKEKAASYLSTRFFSGRPVPSPRRRLRIFSAEQSSLIKRLKFYFPYELIRSASLHFNSSIDSVLKSFFALKTLERKKGKVFFAPSPLEMG